MLPGAAVLDPPLFGLLDFSARALMDEDGRPVAEVASPRFDQVQTELVRCPYGDVRGEGLMNVSALRQMHLVWPSVLASFAGLSGTAPTVSDAWRCAILGITLPLVSPQPTSRVLAGLFKASLGLSQVFSAMLLSDDGVADQPLSALGDADDFFRALDAGRYLVGANQVCAGSRGMIGQVFEALVGPAVQMPDEVEVAAGQAAQAPTLVALHMAHLATLGQRARQGWGDTPQTDHPWLRAVFAVPNRAPSHVRRLFVRGESPPLVEDYLSATRSLSATDNPDSAFKHALKRL